MHAYWPLFSYVLYGDKNTLITLNLVFTHLYVVLDFHLYIIYVTKEFLSWGQLSGLQCEPHTQTSTDE